MNQETKILIGMPCGSGMVPTIMLSSLLQLHKPAPCGFATIDRQRVDKARSFIGIEALKGGFSHLLFVDDDNPIPPDTLEKLLEDDKDIVIAPILSRNPNKEGEYDLCAYYEEDRQVGDKTLKYYNFIKEFKDTGYLHRIDAGGTGCMLIKRRVLEGIVDKYDYIFEFGDITVNGQRRTMSEDVEFCERAAKEGFEIWLDDRIRPFHITGMTTNQWHMR